MNKRLASALGVLCVGLAFVTTTASGQPLVWSDEFDGPDIDRLTWIYKVGDHGFDNGEQQLHTAQPENAYVANGNDPYSLVRDGAWHVLEIPMEDFSDAVDLSQINMLFELLGVSGPIANIEIDDIYLLPGAPPACPGDADCDESISWRDIDFFVTAQNDDVSAWNALHEQVSGQPPTCPFENNDVSFDGTAD